jgi:hypothetical protein
MEGYSGIDRCNNNRIGFGGNWYASRKIGERYDTELRCMLDEHEYFTREGWKRLNRGNSLKNALESLAGVAARAMKDEIENNKDEESMLANWNGRYFTKHGDPINIY